MAEMRRKWLDDLEAKQKERQKQQQLELEEQQKKQKLAAEQRQKQQQELQQQQPQVASPPPILNSGSPAKPATTAVNSPLAAKVTPPSPPKAPAPASSAKPSPAQLTPAPAVAAPIAPKVEDGDSQMPDRELTEEEEIELALKMSMETDVVMSEATSAATEQPEKKPETPKDTPAPSIASSPPTLQPPPPTSSSPSSSPSVTSHPGSIAAKSSPMVSSAPAPARPTTAGGGTAGAMTRLKKELASWQKQSVVEGCSVRPINDDLFVWEATIEGPPDTPYVGGLFRLTITFPVDYPFKPPKVIFITKVYNQHVKGQDICLDILKEAWSPALNVERLLISIRSFLTDPNPDFALDLDIAAQYKRDRAAWERTVKEWVQKYALPDAACNKPQGTS